LVTLQECDSALLANIAARPRQRLVQDPPWPARVRLSHFSARAKLTLSSQSSIVGHNGSGKTSLVSLLSSFVPPLLCRAELTLFPRPPYYRSQKLTSGEILVNGINVLDYSRRDLARVMSFTFQTSRPSSSRPLLPITDLLAFTAVLPMSIKEYVSLGSPSHALTDDSLILRALDASAANAVVDQLGDGWLSYAGGTVGAALSSTEWQLPQLVPRPPGVPSLEMLETEGRGVGLEASMSSEGTLVDGEKEEGEPKKRQAQMRVTSLPTLVNGEEATIHFPDHSPEPCVLSGGQVSLGRFCMMRRSIADSS
jgi:hypothetical protein